MNLLEKRAHVRRKIRIPIVCWETEEDKIRGQHTEIISHDLSAGGLAFISAKMYPLGTLLYVEIHLPGQKSPITGKIKVVHIQSIFHKDRYLIRTSYVDIPQEGIRAIADSIEKMNLYNLLERVTKSGASDLHLTVGRPPMIRLDGRITALTGSIIADGQIAAMIYPLLNETLIEIFEKKKELDFAFSPTINSRFRINLHLQKGFLEATLRSIPSQTKSFAQLGVPAAMMEKFCLERSGLFLIAGTTGSGKTTTLAAMVDYINQTQERVIITIEDPIEYTLKGQKCIIKQRELGSDTNSYAEALKRTLRQDPDVICIGELLDGECLLAAMRAAETGHLVISTVHSPDTIQAIERIVNFFPPEHAESIAQQISSCLVGILFQLLVPGSDGNRILATELLINNIAIKNLIKEKRYSQIKTILQTGRSLGMYTLNSRLAELYEKGLISGNSLKEYSRRE